MAGSPIPPPPSEAASPPGCQRNRLARSRPPRAFGWLAESDAPETRYIVRRARRTLAKRPAEVA
jgi:hypothetical protein